MVMFFDERLGGLPGFGFEFEAFNRSGIILVFIKRVAEFVEGLKSKISKRRVVKENGLIEIDHFRITKRETGFEVKMIIGILGAQKIEKLLFLMGSLARERSFLMSNLAFHKVIVVLVGEKRKQKRRKTRDIKDRRWVLWMEKTRSVGGNEE